MKQLLLMALFVLSTCAMIQAAEPAVGGNCPVCLAMMQKAMAGSEKITSTFDRQTYRFPSAKEKAMFEADPVKFAPVLGGDCVVCRVNTGVRMPGKAEFALVHGKRTYLFPSAKEREAFKAAPDKYQDADLGLDGNCLVCAVMAKKMMPGKSTIVSVYDGIRYFFPSAEEKKVFDTEPAKFVPAFDGCCVVCSKDAGKRVAGSTKFSTVHGSRLYLFPDDGARKAFLSDPNKYANVDLANEGNCIVCATMSKKAMPGKADVASVYKGLRYLFPSDNERRMFDADPARFAIPAAKIGASSSR